MLVHSLRLVNFRNYLDSSFVFSNQLNLIIGENGSGKTSILEALHFIALTKSFRTSTDTEAVHYQSEYFQLFCTVSDRFQEENRINFNLMRNGKKQVLINKQVLDRKTDIIGRFPVVILAPNHQLITEGGPSNRRNFTDRIIAQTDADFLKALLDYRARLYQRNMLLTKYRSQNQPRYDKYIETIDELFVKDAETIIKKRQSFCLSFSITVNELFVKIAHIDGPLDLYFNYNSDSENGNYCDFMLQRLRSRFKRDLDNGKTGCGPHLDDLVIRLKGIDIRKFASKGEHKVIIVALKMAESRYIEKQTDEAVVFLLDDLFAMLDTRHCIGIVNQISADRQTLVTSTDMESLQRAGFEQSGHTKVIHLPLEN